MSFLEPEYREEAEDKLINPTNYNLRYYTHKSNRGKLKRGYYCNSNSKAISSVKANERADMKVSENPEINF